MKYYYMGNCSINGRKKYINNNINSYIIPNKQFLEKNKIIPPDKEIIEKTIDNLQKKIKTQKQFIDFTKFLEKIYKLNDNYNDIYYNKEKIEKIIDILSEFELIDEKIDIPENLTILKIYNSNIDDYNKFKKISECNKCFYNIRFTLYKILEQENLLNENWYKLNNLIKINDYKLLSDNDINKLKKMNYDNCEKAIKLSLNDKGKDFCILKIINFL